VGDASFQVRRKYQGECDSVTFLQSSRAQLHRYFLSSSITLTEETTSMLLSDEIIDLRLIVLCQL